MLTYSGVVLLVLCLFFKCSSQLSEVLNATGQMEHLYKTSQCFSSIWVFCPWRVRKTISQWRHLEEKENIIVATVHCTLWFFFKKKPAFLAKLLTCTKPCEHSAGSFPWRAFGCLQNDTGNHTQGSSKGTYVHECVGELWNCTCWAAALSNLYRSGISQQNRTKRQFWVENKQTVVPLKRTNLVIEKIHLFL